MAERYHSVADIEQANKQAGLHWFDQSTLSFFKSRYGNTVYGGCYFISSEKYNRSSTRRYTIRRATEDGDVETVGNLMQYATHAQAIAALNRLLSQD